MSFDVQVRVLSPVPFFIVTTMINELKIRLTDLGLSEDMATKAIETVADFTKSKLPESLHGAIDDIMAGKNPDLGKLGGLMGGLSGLFK